MSDDPTWLTKTEVIARVVMPKGTEVVRKHTAQIPAGTRKAKRILTEAGIALCLFARLAYEQGWLSPWLWVSCGFFGANYIAGDYRRLFFRSAFAGLSDVTTFIVNAAAKVKEIKAALLSLRNGGPPA